MNALAVSLGLSVKHGVLVLRQHLSLCGHLGLPSLEGLEGLSLLGEGSIDSRNDVVDGSETQAVSSLLELGQSPGDLPQKTSREGIRNAEGAEHRGAGGRRGIDGGGTTTEEELDVYRRTDVNFFPGCGWRSRGRLVRGHLVGCISGGKGGRNIVRPGAGGEAPHIEDVAVAATLNDSIDKNDDDTS